MTRQDDGHKKLFIKTLIPVAIISILALGAIIVLKHLGQSGPGFKGAPQDSIALEPGTTIPDFSIQQIGGSKQSLSDLQSKVTFINFWATWCTPCIAEIPSIIKMRERFKNRGLNVILINVDEKPGEVVSQMIASLGIGFSTYQDIRGQVSELFDIEGIPISVIIDQNRKVLHVQNGDIDWSSEEVAQKIEKWLSQ